MTYPVGNLIPALPGGQSIKLAISTSSAQTSAFTAFNPVYVNAYADTDCFFRVGDNPTALSDGTDQFFPSGPLYRIGPIPRGQKLAFITASGSGYVYITPEN